MISRLIWLLCAYISLGLGIIGVFLPLLPTTPFILLAGFCFSKSSPRLHAWLLAHPLFGSMLQDWQQHGAIATKTKWIATVSMVLLMSYPMFFLPIALWVKLLLLSIMAGVLTFIWTRPAS